MIVLLAEDESHLATLIIDYLEAEGVECDYAPNGRIAMNLLKTNHYDAVILDIEMPYYDGFSVCEQLAALPFCPPVMFISARSELDDKLKAFSLGAVDYICKPFELAELLARLNIMTRVKQPANVNQFTLDTLTVDFGQRQICRSNRVITLSPKQWQLMTLLCHHSPNLVSKDHIMASLWPDQTDNIDKYKTLLNRLRHNLQRDGEPVLLHTHRGAGVSLK